LVRGNNDAATRKHRTVFICQKTYYSPITGAGGNVYNILAEKPFGLDDENDPTQNLDSTVYATADAGRTLGISIVWVYPAADVQRILNHAMCTMLVETGLNATIDDVSVTVGKYNITTAAFTATGTETYQTQPGAGASGLALAGAASRKIKVFIGDTTPLGIAAANERPALRTRVACHRTAGGVAVPVVLHHRRGFLDTYMTIDSLKNDI
jgi:hypothetical protein